MFCWGRNLICPEVQSLGLKSKASPWLGYCGGKENTDSFCTENWFVSRASGAPFLSQTQERDLGNQGTAPMPWPSPSPRASLWKSRLKLPAAAPRLGLPKGCSPPATTEWGRKLLKFLIKLSFHGGDGGRSLNELDHNARPDPLYRTFPYQRKQD